MRLLDWLFAKKAKCVKHPSRSAIGRCEVCGKPFCTKCVVTCGDRVQCIACNEAAAERFLRAAGGSGADSPTASTARQGHAPRVLIIKDLSRQWAYVLGDWFIPPPEIVEDLLKRGFLSGATTRVSTGSAEKDLDKTNAELRPYVTMFAQLKFGSSDESIAYSTVALGARPQALLRAKGLLHD